MKTKEELNTLKKEVESLNKKLAELTEEELAEVSGGVVLLHVRFIEPDDDKTKIGTLGERLDL